MNIRFATPEAVGPSDTLLLLLFEGPDKAAVLPELPAALSAFKETQGLAEASGKFKETGLLYALEGAPCRRVLCLGCGKREEFDAAKLRAVLAAAARQARERGAATLAVLLDGLPLSLAVAVREVALAARFGLYRFRELKTANDIPSDPEEVVLLGSEAGAAEVLILAEAEAAGVALARDLVNRPSNHATAEMLAGEALVLAERHGFACQIMDRAAIEALGMGAFAAVAQGSRGEPRFVVLDTDPDGGKPYCFVGKGVTFDTGGISLKPAAKMEEMKSDMAGAAAVLGCLETIGRLGGSGKTGRRVVGLLPLTDNMPDGGSIKPGDVVRTLSGLTVEIINTDAEGRLLLSDALAFATRLEPELVVDLATLTGAARVALGIHYAAVFSPDEALAARIRSAGLPLGEKFWPLPVDEVYAKELESDTADLKNVGRREGGAIIAAMFLKRFAPEGVSWAHLDIAPTAFQDVATDFWTKGATGFGVRTLVALARGEAG